ncbi:MAG: LacI family DNA-binding transcriptional regulator [Eubacteriales bacterium]|nr:LacI family DNA-binding transcriptional regulator [Eubacteriales bacterium]
MSTIKEISDRANVSIATVSKVLNGKPGVNSETASHVLRIADELHYRPNLNARNLKVGSSRTLGIITEDLTVFNAPEIVDGIAATCDEKEYHYILGNLRLNKRYGNGIRDDVESAALVHATVNDMLSKQVAGIIYIGCHSHIVVSLSEHAEPRFVCAYCISADETIPSVLYDDRSAARDVTELLLNKGHTRIGMISGPADSPHANNRLQGYQEALFSHGVLYDPRLAVYGDWDRDSGYALAGKLLEMGVTAIFAQNDVMATGVMDYCSQAGVEVGRDLALSGFDNREISTVCRPRLTTVALPLFEIGERAARIMFEILENGEAPVPAETLLSCSIIERESTGGLLCRK